MDVVSNVIGAITGTPEEQTPAAEGERAPQSDNGNSGGKIRIQYYRSFIAFPKTQKQIVRSVGLTKLNQIVERSDTPSMRGFVAKVPHLLRIVE
ncbi:MAG: 50S ribosomal protein L30 [Pyrinomonadaceae bacterium]|nr:50S ribosomal protein L30 [Pyrinomonadaceae bacterium]